MSVTLSDIKLKPLYKKGPKIDPKNYRPISLLPRVSKIIEKIIHDQTMEYLTDNSILYRYQSRFRKNHSTDTCLSYLTDKILTGFDSGLLTGMILIDLQKAFDTINHDLLLKKMSLAGSSFQTITWFESYLSNRRFQVNIKNKCSNVANINCGVPQGSILGPLLFLLYVNDIPQAVDCELFLYADDSCLVYQHRAIEKNLNNNFSSICNWFVNNKLRIHFGEDKTKCILFGTKKRLKKDINLNIRYGKVHIKQYHTVLYLGCVLDENLSEEPMALQVIKKINTRLRFLYRKNRFLSQPFRRLLCNAIIQSHFDYGCSAWYPSLNKSLKKKLQTLHNKCIRFCLNLNNRDHIGLTEFEKINWLPINDRFEQCISSTTFKFFNNRSPAYMNDVFKPAGHPITNTRASFLKLIEPLRKKQLSYLAPNIWNSILVYLKATEGLNTFKNNMKKHFLNGIKNNESDIYSYF